MSERAAPFYCPYCGDEDLRPSEETGEAADAGKGAAWECAACNRAFKLAFLGLLARGLRRGDGSQDSTRSEGSQEGRRTP